MITSWIAGPFSKPGLETMLLNALSNAQFTFNSLYTFHVCMSRLRPLDFLKKKLRRPIVDMLERLGPVPGPSASIQLVWFGTLTSLFSTK